MIQTNHRYHTEAVKLDATLRCLNLKEFESDYVLSYRHQWWEDFVGLRDQDEVPNSEEVILGRFFAVVGTES